MKQEDLIKCYCRHTSYCDCIPKEEPKQYTKERIISETSKKTKQKARDYGNSLVNKQETLEEAETVEEYFLANIKNMLQFNNDALAVRFMEKYYYAKKEQDKKMYSEEDVIKMLEYAVHESRMQDDKTQDYIVNETIFEFKKK
jgi:hypothetical protein